METIVGDTVLFVLGNPDILKILAVFGGCVGLISTVLFMYKMIEEWRGA